MQVTVSVAIINCFCCKYAVRSFCSTCAGDSFCSKYVGDNFSYNYAEEVSVAIMQMVFSAVHHAHDCFYCNYAGNSFFYSNVGDGFKV